MPSQAGNSGRLRTVAMIAVVVGAAGSEGFMLRVGHRQSSLILMGLFGIWVLSPFVGLVLADMASRTRAALYVLMMVVALGSLAIYGYVALGPPRPKPAFAFLVVPLVSWVLLGLVHLTRK